MPVYVYRRRDGSTFELEQRITADSLAICPVTRQSVERVMQPFSARYKGTGFYTTDHPRPTRRAPRNSPERGHSPPFASHVPRKAQHDHRPSVQIHAGKDVE